MKLAKIIAILGVSALGQTWVNADTTAVQTKILGPTVTELGGSLVFDQFDSSLGTLTSVHIRLQSLVDTAYTVTNSSAQEQNAIANFNVALYAGGENDFNPAPFQSITVTFPGQFINLGPNASQGYDPAAQSADSGYISYTDSGFMSAFVGGGSINIPVFTLSTFSFSGGGGNLSASQNTVATATASVYYTYTPVPEPGSLVLFGMGGAMVLLARRRRA